MEKNKLRQELTYWRNRHNTGQLCWSVLHHVSVFGSIVCSVSAGAILQFDIQTSWATILTSLAAAFTSLAASGGFERKWISNRLSRSRIDCLLIDLEADNPDLSSIARQLKEVIIQHDQKMVSENKDNPDDKAN